MTIDFTILNPTFAVLAQKLISNMQGLGYKIIPDSGFRTLESQAILWRQSRSTVEIVAQIQKYKEQGCDFLAHVLDSVGPRYGPHATNALPGVSWHQWGEAMDCLVTLPTSPHATQSDIYKSYGVSAIQLGLTAGYNFKTFQDMDHVQLRAAEVSDLYTMKEINDHFEGMAT